MYGHVVEWLRTRGFHPRNASSILAVTTIMISQVNLAVEVKVHILGARVQFSYLQPNIAYPPRVEKDSYNLI